jgi:hypothetical protein
MSPAATTRTDLFADSRLGEHELAGLLRARAASHPDNPGLIAFWPAIPAHRMEGACRELLRRGQPIHPVSIAGWNSDKTRSGWAFGA